MLRVTFLASNAKALQTVITGLAAICEEHGAHGDTFTLYHATTVQASKDESFAVNLVEIHNDEHTLFCSDPQKVNATLALATRVLFELNTLLASAHGEPWSL